MPDFPDAGLPEFRENFLTGRIVHRITGQKTWVGGAAPSAFLTQLIRKYNSLALAGGVIRPRRCRCPGWRGCRDFHNISSMNDLCILFNRFLGYVVITFITSNGNRQERGGWISRIPGLPGLFVGKCGKMWGNVGLSVPMDSFCPLRY
jgi:hypothetical protein